MDREKNLENQHRFVEAKKAQGLKRVILWARPEDEEALRLAARQPHALAKLRKRVEKELERELRTEVAAKLRRRTERALLAQARAEARTQPAGANRPPTAIRCEARPPAALRGRLRAAGWLYDPVAAVWYLPDDPSLWSASERLLGDLEPYGILRLALDRP